MLKSGINDLRSTLEGLLHLTDLKNPMIPNKLDPNKTWNCRNWIRRHVMTENNL